LCVIITKVKVSWAMLIVSWTNLTAWSFRFRDIQVTRIGMEVAWNAHEAWNVNQNMCLLIRTGPIKFRVPTTLRTVDVYVCGTIKLNLIPSIRFIVRVNSLFGNHPEIFAGWPYW
jgi:hypothetical protein